jgi:rRNA maturation RNase YbeY
MRIDVINSQSICVPDISGIKRLTDWFMRQTAALTPRSDWRLVSVLLTDDCGIRLLKQTHFGIHEVTDVISLRYDPIPGETGGCTGEVIVNAQRASELKENRAWNANKELALYIAHGCDHLSGADDHTRAGRTAMRRRELDWLKKAEKARLLGRKPLFRSKQRRQTTELA